MFGAASSNAGKGWLSEPPSRSRALGRSDLVEKTGHDLQPLTGDESEINLLNAIGGQLCDWHQPRRFSQLALVREADISARHLAFVETGWSLPRREMVLHLPEQLEVLFTYWWRRDMRRSIPSASGHHPI